jgi:hypothetical protein
MTVQKAIELFRNHQMSNVKKSTLKSYGKFLDKIHERFSDCEVASVSSDDTGKFLDECTVTLTDLRVTFVMLK